MADEPKDDLDVFKDEEEGDAPEKAEDEPEEGSEEESKDKPSNRKSAIAQKKYWREKAKNASTKVQELEDELTKLKGAVKKPDDDKERAAQDYIRQQARETYKELQLEKAKEEAKELATFEDQVQTLLDDNPDVAEDELLDTIEEYEVEPKTALRILQKQNKDPKEKKPNMPKAKRASASDEDKAKPDDSKKSMWDILKEEKDKLLKK